MPIYEKNIFAIIGRSAAVFTKGAKYMAAITVLTFLPVFIFQMFLPAQNAAAFYALVAEWTDAIIAGADSNALMALVTQPVFHGAADYVTMRLGIFLIFFPLSVAAATYIAKMAADGAAATFDGMLSAVMPRFPKLVVTLFVAALFIYLPLSFGGIFLVILAIYFGTGMIFHLQIVTDLGNWGLRALGLSRQMLRGRWFRVFFGAGTLLILYAAAFGVLDSLGSLLGAPDNVFVALPMFLITHFLLSFFAVVVSVWYFEIKRVNILIAKEFERQFKEHFENFNPFGPFEKKEDDKKDE